MLLFRKTPLLNEKQIDKLSDIFAEIGFISLASVALPAALDKYDPDMLGLGLVTAFIFWIISLLLRR